MVVGEKNNYVEGNIEEHYVCVGFGRRCRLVYLF